MDPEGDVPGAAFFAGLSKPVWRKPGTVSASGAAAEPEAKWGLTAGPEGPRTRACGEALEAADDMKGDWVTRVDAAEAAEEAKDRIRLRKRRTKIRLRKTNSGVGEAAAVAEAGMWSVAVVVASNCCGLEEKPTSHFEARN